MESQPGEAPKGLSRKVFGCHFCELSFSTQASRSHHKAAKHPREHRKLKGHRKSPDHPCKHCHVGYGSAKSKWNHQQRCKSNPEVQSELVKLKKIHEKMRKEEMKKNENKNEEKKIEEGAR